MGNYRYHALFLGPKSARLCGQASGIRPDCRHNFPQSIPTSSPEPQLHTSHMALYAQSLLKDGICTTALRRDVGCAAGPARGRKQYNRKIRS